MFCNEEKRVCRTRRVKDLYAFLTFSNMHFFLSFFPNAAVQVGTRYVAGGWDVNCSWIKPLSKGEKINKRNACKNIARGGGGVLHWDGTGGFVSR